MYSETHTENNLQSSSFSNCYIISGFSETDNQMQANSRQKTIVVYGFPDTVSEDDVQYFFEDSENGCGFVENVLKDQNAIHITFETFQGEKYTNHCLICHAIYLYKHKGLYYFSAAENAIAMNDFAFGGQKLKLEWPNQSTSKTIKVTGFRVSTNTELIQRYFKNNRRSSGGQIEKIIHDAENGTAMITFTSAESMYALQFKFNRS